MENVNFISLFSSVPNYLSWNRKVANKANPAKENKNSVNQLIQRVPNLSKAEVFLVIRRPAESGGNKSAADDK
jgi:hypothetical protein